MLLSFSLSLAPICIYPYSRGSFKKKKLQKKVYNFLPNALLLSLSLFSRVCYFFLSLSLSQLFLCVGAFSLIPRFFFFFFFIKYLLIKVLYLRAREERAKKRSSHSFAFRISNEEVVFERFWTQIFVLIVAQLYDVKFQKYYKFKVILYKQKSVKLK